ncbi:MAG: hypothetical protein KDB37_18015, partial [Ilumatobacter sp.]|nr:hypothetical protein [Ilumatobacter sp.]
MPARRSNTRHLDPDPRRPDARRLGRGGATTANRITADDDHAGWRDRPADHDGDEHTDERGNG